MRHGWLLVFAACTGAPEEPSLTLEGPTEVRVEKLGPVSGPRALRADGTAPEGLVWTVSDMHVAAVRDGRVIALGPGETRIVGTLDDEQVGWTLTVDPAVVLGFSHVPAVVSVGEEAEIGVEARAGDEPVPAGPVDWSSSDPAVLSVAGGKLRGVAPGVAYVTAKRGAAEAMAQVEVRAP